MPRLHGRRGVRRESHASHLQLSQFRTAAPTVPPPSGDVTMGLAEWGMLGNDRYGDCGAAAFEHGRMAKALVSVAGDTPTFEPGFAQPTTSRTEFLYFSYGVAQGEPGPEPDEGVTNATWLAFLHAQGIVEWYGELDVSDADELHSTMLACRGVLLGVGLTPTAEQDFEDHRPWSIGGQPDHDVLMVAYTPSDFTVVTWGGLQAVTGSPAEAWAFGTKEDADRAGYTFAAIQTAIAGAGGSVTG